MTKIIKQRAQSGAFFSSALPPLLQQIYLSRGISSDLDLERGLDALIPTDTMLGLDSACALLHQALIEQQNILIVGDFDADGATSTALMMGSLKLMGAKNVNFLVPNRFQFGYGLSPQLADIAAKSNTQLLITVDNGISSHQGVSKAQQHGMKVIVTDHHLPSETLPSADAIVNPNQHQCQFPSKNLAGVGVAFYLLLALRAHLKTKGYFQESNLAIPNLANQLDLVALGTVADVVPLDKNNRILVHQGLMRIRAGRCRPGISALIQIAKRNQKQLNASDLGFALGPRLNAVGRLDDMSLGIECLLSEVPQHAAMMAGEMDSLNKERREIERSMQHEALTSLSKFDFKPETLPSGIALYQSDWHQGVVGLVASRIKEKFNRPVIAFAQSDNGELKGSGRSIEGLHLRDLLEHIDSQNPGIILKFGGHAMAAGLSIKEIDYQRFNELFDQTASQELTPEMLSGCILTDGELENEHFSLEFTHLLQNAGPWGQAFPQPTFDGWFTIINQRLVGQKHLKLTVQPKGTQQVIDGIAFNVDLKQWPNASVKEVRLVYSLDINEFRGESNLQLMISHLSTSAD